MTFQEVLSALDRVLNTEIITLSGQAITAISLITFALIIFLTVTASRLLQKSANRAMDSRSIHDAATRAITTKLISFTVLGVGVATAVTNIGINLGALFAAGAVFAVGISFAFQNVAQNFLSGLILLFERSIKPMDVLEVEDRVVRVEKMGIRATVARTRDDEQLIIPNTVLAQGTVKNFTMSDSHYRIRVPVGVEYGSDLKHVRQVLEQTVSGEQWRSLRDPVVQLMGFGDSSVDYDVSVWTADPWTAPMVSSGLHEEIWWALKGADVVIAFPQLDVHLAPALEAAVAGLPRAS